MLYKLRSVFFFLLIQGHGFYGLYQESPRDEDGVLRAVQNVHRMIDKEIDSGTNPKDIFICGFSQGGRFILFY